MNRWKMGLTQSNFSDSPDQREERATVFKFEWKQSTDFEVTLRQRQKEGIPKSS